MPQVPSYMLVYLCRKHFLIISQAPGTVASSGSLVEAKSTPALMELTVAVRKTGV